MYIPICPKCGKSGFFHDPCFTPAPVSAEEHAKRIAQLQQMIADLKEMRAKYGIELVCNQRTVDVFESRTDVEELDEAADRR